MHRRLLRFGASVVLAVLLAPVLVYGGIRGLRWVEWRSVSDEGVVFVDQVSDRNGSYALFVRGQNAEAPLLLFLPGGPGESAVPYSAEFTDQLQDHFVIAHAEFGVGRGKPYEEPPTLEEYTADVEALVDHLRAAFSNRRVLLVGNSLG